MASAAAPDTVAAREGQVEGVVAWGCGEARVASEAARVATQVVTRAAKMAVVQEAAAVKRHEGVVAVVAVSPASAQKMALGRAGQRMGPDRDRVGAPWTGAPAQRRERRAGASLASTSGKVPQLRGTRPPHQRA